METKFYLCNHCGNIIEKVKDSGVPVVCCGEKMVEMTANTVDASLEKHTPAVTVDGNRVVVVVGSVEHPMLEEHYIQWIHLETTAGMQRKVLKPGERPVAEFLLAEGEKAVAAYEYCNLHGLWKTEIA